MFWLIFSEFFLFWGILEYDIGFVFKVSKKKWVEKEDINKCYRDGDFLIIMW